MSIRTGAMNQNLTLAKILLLAALFVAPLVMAGCGAAPAEESVANSNPVTRGPSKPSGYYVEMTITPHTVQTPGTIAVRVRVWDARGNMVSGVPVTVVGALDKAAAGTTDANGLLIGTVEIKGDAGGVDFIYVLVEDLELSLPVQIVAAAV